MWGLWVPEKLAGGVHLTEGDLRPLRKGLLGEYGLVPGAQVAHSCSAGPPSVTAWPGVWLCLPPAVTSWGPSCSHTHLLIEQDEP